MLRLLGMVECVGCGYLLSRDGVEFWFATGFLTLNVVGEVVSSYNRSQGTA